MLATNKIWLLYATFFAITFVYDSLIIDFGLILPFIFFWDFVRNLSNKIPIKEIVLTTLSIQCMLFPYLYYKGILVAPDNYSMEVPELDYFNFITPAFLSFAIGISVFKENTYVIGTINKEAYGQIGTQLIVAGIIAVPLTYIFPANMQFFILLISYMKYIGAIYIFYSERKNYWLWVVAAFADIFILSIIQSIFQNFLGWSMFFMLYFFHKRKISTLKAATVISVLMVGVYVLQQTKVSYRNTILESKSRIGANERIDLFFNHYVTSIENENTFSEESFNTNFIRFNQGYVISRIMHHVPEIEPYANGETIRDAFFSSLLPRFLYENKLTVGGGNGLYSRFTGFELVGGTSIDLSIFGEIYANFGTLRGQWFALFIGLVYNLFISLLLRLSKNDIQLIFWIPYLFLIIVRPENAFVPVFNHFAKATVVLFLLYKVFLKNYSTKSSAVQQLTSS